MRFSEKPMVSCSLVVYNHLCLCEVDLTQKTFLRNDARMERSEGQREGGLWQQEQSHRGLTHTERREKFTGTRLLSLLPLSTVELV